MFVWIVFSSFSLFLRIEESFVDPWYMLIVEAKHVKAHAANWSHQTWYNADVGGEKRIFLCAADFTSDIQIVSSISRMFAFDWSVVQVRSNQWESESSIEQDRCEPFNGPAGMWVSICHEKETGAGLLSDCFRAKSSGRMSSFFFSSVW